jgi:hypothetical protein
MLVLWVLGPGRPSLGWCEQYPRYTAYSALAKEGIRIRKEIRLDQLEGFDQLEIGLDLGQLEIGLDMICYDLIGPSLGGQESSLYIKRGDVLRRGAMKKEQTIQFPQIL